MFAHSAVLLRGGLHSQMHRGHVPDVGQGHLQQVLGQVCHLLPHRNKLHKMRGSLPVQLQLRFKVSDKLLRQLRPQMCGLHCLDPSMQRITLEVHPVKLLLRRKTLRHPHL
jgi:hypothetical protein